MKIFLTIIFTCMMGTVFSQAAGTPFIRLTNPYKATNPVRYSRQFLIGATCKECALTINSKRVKVYPTGAFVYELNLLPGDTVMTLLAETRGKSVTKKISYSYALPKPAEPVKALDIESIRTMPEGDLVLKPGDNIRFRVKALTNCTVRAMEDIVLYELPVTQTNGMPGIYQGEYVVKESDSFALAKINISITDSTGDTFNRETSNSFSVLSSLASDIAYHERKACTP
jgi:N-acetylmuramoyl-L-alanine amidase